jgi:hypothetical protein
MSIDYYTPTAVAGEAIDACGLNFTLDDIESGTKEAQVCLRQYYTCLDQLFRAAPWNTTRKQIPLQLIGDATGQTTDPLVSTDVPAPWIYAYAYPTDCARIRYIPWNPLSAAAIPSDNIVPENNTEPLMSNFSENPYSGLRLVPSRFLVTSDVNFIEAGAGNETPGSTPIGRTIICTNVQNAIGIYSYKAYYPNQWDSQFRAAMVAYMASMIALPLWSDKDPRMGMTMRQHNIAIAQEKIKSARITDGQEGWHSSDLSVDWMRARRSGGAGYRGAIGDNIGDWSCTWDNIGWGGSGGNSSVF